VGGLGGTQSSQREKDDRCVWDSQGVWKCVMVNSFEEGTRGGEGDIDGALVYIEPLSEN